MPTLIVVMIKLPITKLIRILNFNCVGVLNMGMQYLKGLI